MMERIPSSEDLYLIAFSWPACSRLLITLDVVGIRHVRYRLRYDAHIRVGGSSGDYERTWLVHDAYLKKQRGIPSFEMAPRMKKSQSDSTAIALEAPRVLICAVRLAIKMFFSCSKVVYCNMGLMTKKRA